MSRLWWLAIPVALVATPVIVLISLFAVAVIPWWGLFSGLFVVGLIILWGAVVYDLFRRADVSGFQIALWLALVVVLPLIGAFAYYATRPPASEIRYRGEQVA